MRSIFEFMVVMLVTLFSYYFYSINVAVAPIVSLTILLWLTATSAKSRRSQFGSLGFVIAVTVVFIVNISVAVLQAESVHIYARSILGILIGPLYLILFDTYYSSEGSRLSSYIKYALLIHIGCLFAQVALFYTTGSYMDLLRPITGEEQRYVHSLGGGLIRPTGLFNEPATYSLTIITLLFIRRRFRSPLGVLDYAALASVMATLSVSGFVMALSFALINLLVFSKKILRNLLYAAIVAAGLLTPFGVYLTGYVTQRLSHISTDVSFVSRFQSGLESFQAKSLAQQLLGAGIGNSDTFEFSYGSTYSYLFDNMGILFAVLFLLAVVVYLRFCKINIPSLIFLGVIFLGTFQITYVIFWFIIGAITVLEKSEISTAKAAIPASPDWVRDYSPVFQAR